MLKLKKKTSVEKIHAQTLTDLIDWLISPDIADFLYEKVLPQLQEKLMSYEDLDETQLKENEESYLLSDIFQDINEDEDVEEEDNEGNKDKETQERSCV